MSKTILTRRGFVGGAAALAVLAGCQTTTMPVSQSAPSSGQMAPALRLQGTLRYIKPHHRPNLSRLTVRSVNGSWTWPNTPQANAYFRQLGYRQMTVRQLVGPNRRLLVQMDPHARSNQHALVHVTGRGLVRMGELHPDELIWVGVDDGRGPGIPGSVHEPVGVVGCGNLVVAYKVIGQYQAPRAQPAPSGGDETVYPEPQPEPQPTPNLGGSDGDVVTPQPGPQPAPPTLGGSDGDVVTPHSPASPSIPTLGGSDG